MDFAPARSFGEILKDRNIILRGADAATEKGFTQVPNFLLRSAKLSPGDKMTFAMLLSYAWHNDFSFPGQARLGRDLGLSDRSVRTHIRSLESHGLLKVQQRGQGRTNIYELFMKPGRLGAAQGRKKTSGLDRKETSALERKKTSATL